MSVPTVNIHEIYLGCNGQDTLRLYAVLEKLGPPGIVGINLFRAHKASSRAKVYRGHWKGRAYEKKAWSLGLLTQTLNEHSALLGISWGWKTDPAQKDFPWVLYVDLPNGQASFHMGTRGIGPDYAGEWDGKNLSAYHIVRFIENILK